MAVPPEPEVTVKLYVFIPKFAVKFKLELTVITNGLLEPV